MQELQATHVLQESDGRAGRTGENERDDGKGELEGQPSSAAVGRRKKEEERKVTAKATASKEAGALSEKKVRSAENLPHTALAGQVVKQREFSSERAGPGKKKQVQRPFPEVEKTGPTEVEGKTPWELLDMTCGAGGQR